MPRICHFEMANIGHFGQVTIERSRTAFNEQHEIHVYIPVTRTFNLFSSISIEQSGTAMAQASYQHFPHSRDKLQYETGTFFSVIIILFSFA